MKVSESNNYNSEFPEKYPWGSVDSIVASGFAADIINWIEHDLRGSDRLLVPGLRRALNILAKRVNV